MASQTYKKGVVVKLSANFNSTEFDCHGSGCCSVTLINPILVQYLQQIRDHFGKPITITSGYRCIRHNSNIGSGTGSQHVKGNAADIVVHGVAPREVAKYAESIGILGIGLYETGNDGYFVHIDTRTVKAFWYGQAQAYRSTFGGTNITTNSTTNSIINNVVNTTGSTTIILDKGDRGEAVKELQANLILLGYSCGDSGIDGVFGGATEAAVRQFQKEYSGISVDGISGYQTLSAIKNAIEKKAYRVQITASILNVRSGASMNHTIVGNVKKNSTYLILETKNNWGKLNSPNGYISLRYAKKI